MAFVLQWVLLRFDGRGGALGLSHTFRSLGFWKEEGKGVWEVILNNSEASSTAIFTGGSLTLHGYEVYGEPVLNAISPAIIAENNDVTITLTGEEFVGSTRAILIDNDTVTETQLSTEFVNANTLRATIPAALVVDLGTYQIKAVTPDHALPSEGEEETIALNLEVVDALEIVPNSIDVTYGGIARASVIELRVGTVPNVFPTPVALGADGTWSYTVTNVNGNPMLFLRAETVDGEVFISDISAMVSAVIN